MIAIRPIDNDTFVFYYYSMKSPLETTRKKENRGRKYYSCGRYKCRASYSFISWVDAEINQLP